jgi:hypothetical protein
MRLLSLLEKTKKGKFGRGQTYSLYMPNGGEDGVLIGWRADWPQNKYVEFRGPPYSQWEGAGSDFELVHDALEGRHSTVLHTNDILDVIPTHPRYDLIKNAIDNDVLPPMSRGYAFERASKRFTIWYDANSDERFVYPWSQGSHHEDIVKDNPEVFGIKDAYGMGARRLLDHAMERGWIRSNYMDGNLSIEADYEAALPEFIKWVKDKFRRINAVQVELPGNNFRMTGDQVDRVLMTGKLNEAMGIAPDMAAKIVRKKDLEKYQAWQASGEKAMPYGLHAYRVTGWYCPKAPPKLTKDNMHDNMNDILSQLLWDAGDDFDKMRPCQRKDATHVTGSGVSGILAEIGDVAVVGRVAWSPEKIQQEKNSWNKRVMMGESLTEEVVPFTKQWAPSDIALTKIWQIVQALIKKGMGDELNGLFDNFKFAIQQYNELAAERSQHSELAELSDRHLHQIYEYGKKVHWQPLSRAGFKARQRMIAQSWGKEVTEGSVR